MKDFRFFSFKACNINPWCGRYNRIPGQTTTFKIKFSIEKQAFWPIIEWNRFDETLFCPACETTSRGIEDLVEAVNKAKIRISRRPGGTFLINEFSSIFNSLLLKLIQLKQWEGIVNEITDIFGLFIHNTC